MGDSDSANSGFQDHSRRSPGDPLQGIVQEFHDYGTNERGQQVVGTSVRRVEMHDHSSGEVGTMIGIAASGIPFERLAVGGYRGYKAWQSAKRLLQNGNRGRASEARVLKDLGLTKNTETVSTAEGSAIPDALTDALSVEIKDSINVSLTRQLRIQTQAAREAGRESILATGENTCVSGPCSRAFDTIIRRIDLGPLK